MTHIGARREGKHRAAAPYQVRSTATRFAPRRRIMRRIRIDTFTRTVAPRRRIRIDTFTVTVAPRRRIRIDTFTVTHGRRPRPVTSSTINILAIRFVAHHFYRCSVSFVAVPPRAAAAAHTDSRPLHRAPRLKGRLQHRRPGKPMTAVTALHCRHSGLHVQAARPTSNVTRGRQRRAAPPPARRAAPLRTRSTSSRHDLRITIPATRKSRDAACT
jgi:hypothetical protein